ncbi:hypothetical protein ACT8ZV_17925 [Nocardioides sp. MAHUQ-72]|uniref:hypothetical protein n=1 Tax=unclassified Nocardioides TaxID=2615069 RepID=UPI00360E2EA4
MWAGAGEPDVRAAQGSQLGIGVGTRFRGGLQRRVELGAQGARPHEQLLAFLGRDVGARSVTLGA